MHASIPRLAEDPYKESLNFQAHICYLQQLVIFCQLRPETLLHKQPNALQLCKRELPMNAKKLGIIRGQRHSLEFTFL